MCDCCDNALEHALAVARDALDNGRPVRVVLADLMAEVEDYLGEL